MTSAAACLFFEFFDLFEEGRDFEAGFCDFECLEED